MSLIVDGNNLSARVLNAYPELTTKSGKRIHVIYGVLKLLGAALKKFKPDSIQVTWDGTPKFRKEVYPEYKVKRHSERTPDEQEAYKQYIQQIDELKLIIPHLGIKQYAIKNIEADDLISILAEQLNPCLILSEDKDFLQLVGPETSVYQPIQDRLVTIDNFLELFELTPYQYLNFRVITGDTSDEIKGVKGIGEKTYPDVKNLIIKYGDVHTMLKYPDELRKFKRVGNILDNVDTVVRNFILMDLSHSQHIVDCDISEGLIPGRFDEVQIKKVFLQLEFFSFLKSMQEFLAPFRRLS